MQPSFGRSGDAELSDGHWERRDNYILWHPGSEAVEACFSLKVIGHLLTEEVPAPNSPPREGTLLGTRTPGSLLAEACAPDSRETGPDFVIGYWHISPIGTAFPSDQETQHIRERFPVLGRNLFLTVRTDWSGQRSATAFLIVNGRVLGRSPVLALDGTAGLRPEAARHVPTGRTHPPAALSQLREQGRDFSPEAVSARADRRRMLQFAGVAVLCGACVVALLLFLFRSRVSGPDADAGTSPLGLSTSRAGSQVRITWNCKDPIMQSATGGKLSIADGPIRKDVELGPGELQHGSVIYTATGGDVNIRLEVVDGRRGRSVSETVRLLGSTWPELSTSPGVLSSGSIAADALRDTHGEHLLDFGSLSERRSSTRTASAPLDAEETAGNPNAAAVPLRQLTMPQRSQAAVLPPAPDLSGRASLPASAPRISPGIPAVAPPPLSTETRPGSPAPGTVVVETPVRPAVIPAERDIQPAILLRRTEPVFPAAARHRGFNAVVKLTAVIGKDGHLYDVHAVSGPGILRAAAENAVRSWLYRPTMINGKPIENGTDIEVRFRSTD